MTHAGSGDPVLGREQAPDHGPNFWGDLEASLTTATSVMDQTVAHRDYSPTEQLPKVAVMPDRGAATSPPPARRLWPMAAAAAVLAIVGMGVLMLQRTTEPSTPVVAGTTQTTADTADSAAALDGPTDDAADQETSSATAAEASGDEGSGTVSADGESVNAGADDAAAAAGAESTDADATGTEPAQQRPPREFESAIGAEGSPDFLPFDNSLSPAATFLANWEDRALTWYADIDETANCADSNVSTISFVNGSGAVQDVRDPQLGFSGVVSRFTLHPEAKQAAWLVSCGSQLELYTATLSDLGQVEQLNLVWFGQGSSRAGRLFWNGTEINLNAIDPSGTPLAIAYDQASDELTRNDGPGRTVSEPGTPIERAATPIAATVDGRLSYWVGQAPANDAGACTEFFDTDPASTLWLRQDQTGQDGGTWQPAMAEALPLGQITAAAIEPELSQIVIADVCNAGSQRIVLGTISADGRIGRVHEVSLAPFSIGFATELFWVDPQTLRIEIDNTANEQAPDRLEYRFDDGYQTGIIVELN